VRQTRRLSPPPRAARPPPPRPRARGARVCLCASWVGVGRRRGRIRGRASGRARRDLRSETS
jgi:hypothetical protein